LVAHAGSLRPRPKVRNRPKADIGRLDFNQLLCQSRRMLPLFLAASVFAAPQPINASSWFAGSGVHPKEGPPTLIATEITVTPHGSPLACRASVTSGAADWAPFACARIKDRAFFKPASVDGQRVYGIYRVRIAWIQHGPLPADLHTWDFEVPVNNVPADLKLPVVQKIQFVVDTSGSIKSCNANGPWSHPELLTTACSQVARSLSIEAARGQSGEPEESVQDASVRFVSASP